MIYSTILYSDTPEDLEVKLAWFVQSFNAVNIHQPDAEIISVTQSESMTGHQTRSDSDMLAHILVWNGTISIIYRGREKIS